MDTKQKQIIESYIKKQVRKQLNEVTEFDNLEDVIKSYKIEVIKDIDEKSKQIKVWIVYKISKGTHYTAAVCASKKGAELILAQLKSNDLEQLDYDYKIEETKSELYLNSRNQVKMIKF